jgi:hypothetical protein
MQCCQAVNVEYVRLCESFQLPSNQGAGILHDIGRPDRVDRKSIDACGLEAKGVCLLLLCRRRSVRYMPDVFDNPKQDCAQNLDGRVFCGIKTWAIQPSVYEEFQPNSRRQSFIVRNPL